MKIIVTSFKQTVGLYPPSEGIGGRNLSRKPFLKIIGLTSYR